MSVSLGYGSSRTPDTMDDLEKQLVCPICLEVFSKPVVILPCQHNLCRKCANDIFQASNPYLSSRSGGRFRCPSCRHEVVLDRHGVYGLQRNLLVENIIDMFKQETSSSSTKPEPEVQVQKEGPMCDEHGEERINIYCVTCATPTCSLCKVFGAHKDCQVAPLNSIYDSQKTELTDCISMLVGNNGRIQGIISQLEESCRAVEENGRRQKARVCEAFDHLYALLEDRKSDLTLRISGEQDEKVTYITRLRRRYGDHLDSMAQVVEKGISTMEEPEMALFLQNTKPLLKQIKDGTTISHLEKLERGYENMEHFSATFYRVRRALLNIDFIRDDDGVEEAMEEGGEENPTPSGTNPAPPASSTTPSGTNPAPPASSTTPSGTNPAPPASSPTPSGTNPAPPASIPTPSGTNPAPPASSTTPSGTNPAPPASSPTPSGTNPAPPASSPIQPGTNPAPPASSPTPSGTNPAPPASSTTPSGTNPAPPASSPTQTGTSPAPLVSNPSLPGSNPAPTASSPKPLQQNLQSSPQLSAPGLIGSLSDGAPVDDGENPRHVFSFSWLNSQ